MIESKIIDLLDFGDSIQKIEPYKKPYLELYFRFFRTLLKHNSFPIIIYIILIIISFIQILSLSSIILSHKNDIILEILFYLKNIVLLSEIITSGKIFFIFFICILILILLDIILLIIILFTMKVFEFPNLIFIINLINIIIFYYLIGPIVDICLMTFWCENGIHKFFYVKCYFNKTHYNYLIISILLLLLYIIVSFFFSKYCNEIGYITINKKEKLTRISNNYEIFCLFSKILIFIFYYIIKAKNDSKIIKLLYQASIFFISLIMSIYSYKYVYYNNKIINYINYFGWSFCSWFSFVSFFKILFLKNITSFIIIGWIIIFIILYKAFKMKEFILLTEFKIFKITNVKSIETFKNNVLEILSNKNEIKSKILLHGILKNFEEYHTNKNPEINYLYQKILNDKYLNHKYSKIDELPLLSIIYILYSIQMDKLSNKDEIILHMCYFLINKFSNWAFAIFLASTIKKSNHMNLYYKYLLTEEIKDSIICKLNRNSNKDSIKYIQIGSVIVYYLYIDLFKLKIYDAICNQIDYFEELKDNNSKEKKIDTFLKNGNCILKKKNEIKMIWGKLITLNPFSDETFKDYSIYLDSILQDEILSKEESKKYMLLKNNKIEEKLNIYHSMFLFDKSSVIIADGHYSNGKIIYASPNFPMLFTYNLKEILNINIEDLLPNVIQPFHKELIEDAIKYSNLNFIFKKQINSLLKNKNGGLFNIKLFVKPIPNLNYGLTFFIYLQKIIDLNFIIVLDKDLRINGFSQTNGTGSSFAMDGRYNLSQGLYGYHIGLIIPDILTLLEFKNGEFNIIKKNLDLKGYLYQINKIKDIKNKVDIILDKIKSNINDNQIQIEDGFHNINDEFNALIKELNNQNIKAFSIFYKIKMSSFLDEKYKYYRIYINDDIITGNENNQILKKRFKKTESKITKHLSIISENSISKQNKRIKKKINEKTLGNNNIINDNEISNIEEINSIINKDNYKQNEKINNEEKGKINNKYLNSKDFQTSNIYSKFNKIKLDIINKKNIYPIRIMIYLCFAFSISTIILMIKYQKSLEKSFSSLSTFLDENIFFNMTKMTIAVLYITSINIKWQLHSCNLTSLYNMSSLNEEMLFGNIYYLGWIKNFTNNLGKDYKEILLQKHDIELRIYGSSKKEKYRYDFNNLLTFFINSEINLLDIYPSLLIELNTTKEQRLSPLTKGLNELNDLADQTYNFYISGIKGFQGEEKTKKINEIFRNSSICFILCGIILIIIIIIFIIYILILNSIESFFVNKLLNFNSNNFDNYIKQLDEIKKKFGNDNNEEEEKEDMNINGVSTKNLKFDEKNKESDKMKPLKKEKIIYNKNDKKQSKMIKQRRNKIKLMKSYFIKYNLFFGMKILLIMLLSLFYYIISIFLENNQKNEFLMFDTINDSMIGILKESYDNFISMKRQLELFENNLTNCKIDNKKDRYIMKLPLITDIKSQNFGNYLIEIASGSGYNSKTLSNLTELFKGDACKLFSNNKEEYSLCDSFFNGILTEGMEQTLIKMVGVIGEILEELKSVNTGGRTFNEIIMSSSFISYELFIEFYYQKAYRLIDEIFWKLRNEKVKSIFKAIKILLSVYINITFFLLLLLFYFIFKERNIFNSFLNFICIIPSKYILEDKKFLEEIVKIGSNYF